MADNPYAPPKSYVADTDTVLPDGDFNPAGRTVAAGNGWQWIADAWNLMAGQRLTFVGICLLYFFMWLGVQLVPFFGPIAAVLFTPVVFAGIMIGCDAVRRGDALDVGHLFAGFERNLGKLVAVGAISLGLGFLIGIVFFVIAGVSFFTMLSSGAEPNPEQIMSMGLMLLLAALVALAISLPVYMLLWFSAPLIILADLEVGAALKASFSGCLKNVLPFLIWGVVILVFIILTPFTLFLGWLLLGPIIAVSVYTGYRDIYHETA
jgi:hypothetical protein